jgi:hypothetical protein
MPTNVPQPVFSPTGLQIPTAAQVLAGVQADIDAAFGGNLNFTSPSTPQNQLATSIAAMIFNTYEQFLFLTNMFDPQYALGRYQDALSEAYDLTRQGAEPTVVQATCSGLTGAVIPVGALAQDTSGNIYTCTEAGTIPPGGTIVLEFAANVPGATPCPAGTLINIYQAIPGWDSITNAADGVIGQATETRAQFEAQRQATLQSNASAVLAAIRGAVLQVPGVLDCYTSENDTNGTQTIGGVALVANSIYVAVEGGAASAVAQAIFTKKPPGSAMNGNTTVTVQDTSPPYVPPYPSYSIKFEIPAALPILFAVSIVNGPNVPANALQQVQSAIVAVFSGNGGTRPAIGSTIFASNFFAAVAALGPWAQIVSLLIGSPNMTGAQFTATIDNGSGTGSPAGTTMTVSSVASGTLAVGQFITDTTGHIVPGTIIIGLMSGSGNTGTYTVSISQGVTSEVMSGTVPASNSVMVRADQTPTINAANITLTLV